MITSGFEFDLWVFPIGNYLCYFCIAYFIKESIIFFAITDPILMNEHKMKYAAHSADRAHSIIKPQTDNGVFLRIVFETGTPIKRYSHLASDGIFNMLSDGGCSKYLPAPVLLLRPFTPRHGTRHAAHTVQSSRPRCS